MTITAAFAAPVEQVWSVWSDPRKLERWWGPPTYPATVVEHDLSPGGGVTYFMTGPEGDRHGGLVAGARGRRTSSARVRGRLRGRGRRAQPGHADDVTRVSLTADDGGTTMAIETTFPSPRGDGEAVEMGLEEGLTLAVGQIDGLLD